MLFPMRGLHSMPSINLDIEERQNCEHFMTLQFLFPFSNITSYRFVEPCQTDEYNYHSKVTSNSTHKYSLYTREESEEIVY